MNDARPAGRVASAYFAIRRDIVHRGYGCEIRDLESLRLEATSRQDLFAAVAWAILSVGFSARAVAAVWPRMSVIVDYWSNPRATSLRRRELTPQLEREFANSRKVAAIFDAAECVSEWDLEQILADVAAGDTAQLETIPFIGPVSVLHVTRNLGADVAKPDRHLCRLADAVSMSPQALCEMLASVSTDPVRVVDGVLWRASVIQSRNIDGLARAVREHHTCSSA
jgi:hypothetical protein